MNMLERISKIITKFLPLWVIVFSLYAFFNPEPLKPYAKDISYLLGIIMLGMGLTMSIDDFKLVLTRPKDVFFGVFFRYLIMPFVGFAVAKMLGLPPALAAGLILVGCCPSGTASNVMTFLARGDTALSVTVSSVNTILAPVLTPYIFLLLAGTLIPIKAEALLIDILKIVIVPIALGVGMRTLLSSFVDKIMKIVPVVSVVCIVFVIAIVIALNASKLMTVAVVAFAAVALHNAIGLGLGYGASRAVGMSEDKSKAICFEIGMENSGLAAALALAHLDPIAAVPGAIFSVWHNLTGSVLAGYWSSKKDKEEARAVSN
ncbi:Pantothenate precursors transporter PanS [bioreactor metagenome]|uniref:Pantothenates transporter PanS n=1 Tax=bioreactor metagenome TaxID=1076179 RepID=A0A644W1M7_9ZZZZ